MANLIAFLASERSSYITGTTARVGPAFAANVRNTHRDRQRTLTRGAPQINVSGGKSRA